MGVCCGRVSAAIAIVLDLDRIGSRFTKRMTFAIINFVGKGGKRIMVNANNILLFLVILLSCATLIQLFYKRKETVEGKEWIISDRVYWIILGIGILIAVAVRVYRFGSVPGGMNQDGAMAAVDAKALADYATDRFGMFMPVHLTAWGYGQMSSLLSYLMVPFIKVAGLSVVTARLPLLLVSLAGLVCLYLFVRDVFDKHLALLVFLFAAINPWHILQSRWALDCNLLAHFLMIALYFLYKGLTKTRYLVISMIFFGLSMYCYGISIYSVPLFLLASCIYLLIKKKITIKQALICVSVWLLVAWPFIATMAINFFRMETIETPFFTIPFFPDSVRSNDILFFSDNFGEQLVANIKSFVNLILLQTKDLPWNDVEGFGTMYLFSLPFALLGIVALFKKHRQNPGAILLFFFLLTGVWVGITTNGININRINLIFYPLMCFVAYGIYEAIHFLSFVKYVIGVAYLIFFCLFTNTYFTTYADEISQYFFQSFGEAVTAVADSDAERLYITADSQYEGASTVSEILTLFYHDIDAKYFQSEDFHNRYVFESIQNITINPQEDAEYVVTANDMQYFDLNQFTFKQYGHYLVVKPKNVG